MIKLMETVYPILLYITQYNNAMNDKGRTLKMYVISTLFCNYLYVTYDQKALKSSVNI